MFKRLLFVIAPMAAVAVLAVAPGAASGNKVTKCPKGTTDKHYCKKVIVCKVPSVVGKPVKAAQKALRRHDCRARIKKHHFKGGIVVKQSAKPGKTFHKGHKVRLKLEPS